MSRRKGTCLTEETVAKIRALRITPAEIARRRGCSSSFAQYVVSREVPCPAAMLAVIETIIAERIAVIYLVMEERGR